MDIIARVKTKALDSMKVYILFQTLGKKLTSLEKVCARQLENHVSLFKLYDSEKMDQRSRSRNPKQSYF